MSVRPTSARRAEPLTDPFEFWALIGRFMAAQVLGVLFVIALLRQSWFSVALFGVASLFLHRAMIRDWRRLSAARQEAIAKRAAGSKDSAA